MADKDYNLKNYRPPGPFDNRVVRAIFVMMYIVIILLPVIFVAVFSEDFIEDFVHEPFESIAKTVGLIAFAMLVMQVALGSRLKTLDRIYAINNVLIFHKNMAITAGVLIVLHPTMMVISHGISILGIETAWQIIVAEVAWIAVLSSIAVALYRSKIRLDYNIWHVLHKGMIVVIALVFIHSYFIGGNIEGPVRFLWWALLGTAIAIFIYRNVFFIVFVRRPFDIISVEPETHDTYTIRMKPKNDVMPKYRPGQFMFLKLKRENAKTEEHPFTISSSPTFQNEITATIKESGDFTNTIGETTTDDSARVAAPYGKFSFVHSKPEIFLFIAGGVGITPIMSMIRFLRDTGDGRRVMLLFACRKERDIVFRDEIEDLPDNFKHVYILSKPDEDWDGLTGFVDENILRDQAGDIFDGCEVYLCGPPVMMDAVESELRKAGYKGPIHTERFALD